MGNILRKKISGKIIFFIIFVSFLKNFWTFDPKGKLVGESGIFDSPKTTREEEIEHHDKDVMRNSLRKFYIREKTAIPASDVTIS